MLSSLETVPRPKVTDRLEVPSPTEHTGQRFRYWGKVVFWASGLAWFCLVRAVCGHPVYLALKTAFFLLPWSLTVWLSRTLDFSRPGPGSASSRASRAPLCAWSPVKWLKNEGMNRHMKTSPDPKVLTSHSGAQDAVVLLLLPTLR